MQTGVRWIRQAIALLLLLVLTHAGFAQDEQAAAGDEGVTPRPRVIISTDIGGLDNDDYQSMVHYLVYADRFDTEGLISSPPGDGRVDHILECIDAYAADYANLSTWSDAYPEPEALRAVVYQGAIEVQQGETPAEQISAGAQHIIERANADDDDRPLYVLVWGSMTDLAQALSADPTIAERIRVYSIGSWNTRLDPLARNYVYNQHPGLWWIEADTTFRGMYVGGRQDWLWGNEAFPELMLSNGGELNGLYLQKKTDLKMGDTPSVLYLLQGDPDDPEADHWGGSFIRPSADDRPTYWHDRATPELAEGEYNGARTVSRHREAILSDWMRRVSWSLSRRPGAEQE